MTTAQIDANEASQTPVLVEVFEAHDRIDTVSVAPLTVGDFTIDGCVFERKQPADFAESIKDSRLQDQLDRLDELDSSTFCLIEGDQSDFENDWVTRMSAASIRAMIASITVNTDTSVLCCSSMTALVDVAVWLAVKATSDTVDIQGKPATAQHTEFLPNLFMGVEGIGETTARKLAERFDTVQSIAAASADEFEQVDGIGPTKATRLAESTQ